MKHLFIVRDGEYSPEHRTISRYGRQQMQGLGMIIKEISNGGSIHIISSPTKSSTASANELAYELGLKEEYEVVDEKSKVLKRKFEFEIHPYFFNFHMEEYPKSCNKSIHIINRRRKLADSLIIISNIYTVRALVPYATFKFLDEAGIANTERHGTGMHIDLEKRIYEPIPKRE
jgi:hypothetical protein